MVFNMYREPNEKGVGKPRLAAKKAGMTFMATGGEEMQLSCTVYRGNFVNKEKIKAATLDHV